MTSTTALSVHDLARVYGAEPTAVRALDGVDLAFHTGTFTAVMGPSGSGQSTFLHCAGGLETPTEGRVVVDGEGVTDGRSRAEPGCGASGSASSARAST
jgi:putative ABC transport system ATP-binding protein